MNTLIILAGAGQGWNCIKPQFIPLNKQSDNLIIHVVDPLNSRLISGNASNTINKIEGLDEFIENFKKYNINNNFYTLKLEDYINKKLYNDVPNINKILIICFTAEIKEYPTIIDNIPYISLSLGHTAEYRRYSDYFIDIQKFDFNKIKILCEKWFIFKSQLVDFSIDSTTEIVEHLNNAKKHIKKYKDLYYNTDTNNIIQEFYKMVIIDTNPFLYALERRRGMLNRIIYLSNQNKTHEEIKKDFERFYIKDTGTFIAINYPIEKIKELHKNITILEKEAIELFKDI